MAEVDFSSAIILALIQSAPSTLAVIAGFFIFHILASRRQKRDELFASATRVKDLADKAADELRDTWALSGKEATETGAVVKLRLLISHIANEYQQLCDQEKEFLDAKQAFQAFRRSADEFEDPLTSDVLNIADTNRPAYERGVNPAVVAARAFSKSVSSSYWNRYRS
jgi:hypothetical protein